MLTAAHCLRGQTPSDMFVRLGSYDFSDNADPASVDYQVKSFRIHPQYDKFTQSNDIAILALDGTASFTSLVRPICLPQTSRNYQGAIGTVVGWGAINFGTKCSHSVTLSHSLRTSNYVRCAATRT